jgi:hypothetical protein
MTNCLCGKTYIPKNFSIVINGQEYSTLHEAESLLESGEIFSTISEALENVNIHSISIDLPITLQNQIKIVIKTQSGKIIATKYIGVSGQTVKLDKIDIPNCDLLITSVSERVVLQIYSICDFSAPECCDRLPNFSVNNIVTSFCVPPECDLNFTLTTATPPTTTTTTTTTTTIEPSCDWDGDGLFDFAGICGGQTRSVQWVQSGPYTWTYTRPLACDGNSVTGTISCNPNIFLTEFNSTTCASKWSGSISSTCGSVSIGTNDGNCSNDLPPFWPITSDLSTCPGGEEGCCNCCNLEGLTVNFMGTSKTITEEDIVGGKVIIRTGATSEDYCVDEECTEEIPGDYQDQYLELSCNSNHISVFVGSCCYRVFSDPQIPPIDYCKAWTGKIYFDANCNPEQLTDIECTVGCGGGLPNACEPTDPLGSLSVSKNEPLP